MDEFSRKKAIGAMIVLRASNLLRLVIPPA